MSESKDLLAQLLEEYESLSGEIERNHPGCLRRSDQWRSGDDTTHGYVGGRKCPASEVHRKRSEVLARYVELVAGAPNAQAT